MKKIFILVILSITLFSCTSLIGHTKVKEEICKELEAKTGDKFYFIYGLDRERSIATNIKYRGIIYSDRLKDMHITEGVEIGLASLDNYNINYILNSYMGLLNSNQIDRIAEKKAKELFGEKTSLYNDGSTTEYMYNNIMGNLGNNLSFEKKSGYYGTIVNVFVDDLNKIDITEFRKKTFELAKYLNEYMNYRSYLQVYVRDDKYLNDFSLVNMSIYMPFIYREDIKIILKKIKKKEKLNDEEEKTIMYSFRKGGLDYKSCHFKMFLIEIIGKVNFPLKLENSLYESESLNDKTIYSNTLEKRKPILEQRIIE